MNPFQHVDVRVRDMQAALAFYSKILPAVGFTLDQGGKLFHCFSAGGTAPATAWFGFTEDPSHQPNANRIAFQAASREDVDRLGVIIRQAGGRNISGPRDCPEYTATYYAVFFEDLSGNCLEVCYLEEA